MTTIAGALLIVLVFASSAWAEGSWVLWSHAYGRSDSGETVDRHEVAGAYPTRNECLKMVRGYATVMKDAGMTVTGGEYETGSVIGEKGNRSMKYSCLPDTVDPRGAKGK